ncbi:MAG TPA: Tim44-like domain-containing protein [Ideonella sp.]|nr:Tim44-like domain-containing protein [Ideonella sp.]
MKSLWLALCMTLAGLSLSVMPLEADAKRLGGGKAAGMQRQTPPQQSNATPATPNQAAAPAAAGATGAAAAAGKRSWMGPIAGIAAGLGIAALMSHLGMGEAMGNFLTMALFAIAAIFLVRFLLRKFASGKAGSPVRPQGMQLAGAGNAPMPDERPAAFRPEAQQPLQRNAFEPAAAAVPAAAAAMTSTLPGFDAEGFERIAKMIFVRMQAANDSGDVEDLRKFTTPELFASLRVDLQERGDLAQQTDVVQLNAKVVDTAQEGSQSVVSVRFDGLIREETGGAATPFDEIWHLVRPADGSREWAIAGITPTN